MQSNNLKLAALVMLGAFACSSCEAANAQKGSVSQNPQKPSTNSTSEDDVCFPIRREVINHTEQVQFGKYNIGKIIETIRQKARAMKANQIDDLRISATVQHLTLGPKTPNVLDVEGIGVAVFCAPPGSNRDGPQSKVENLSLVEVFDIKKPVKTGAPIRMQDYINRSNSVKLNDNSSAELKKIVSENMLPSDGYAKTCPFVPDKAFSFVEDKREKVVLVSTACKSWRIGDASENTADMTTIDIDRDYQAIIRLIPGS